MADLGGSPGLHHEVVSFAGHCIMMRKETDLPHTVTWSDTNNPEVWTGGNSGYLTLSETSDFIVGASSILDKLYIFKERSIWELVYVGYPNIFEAAKIIDGVGLISNNSMENLGDKIYFLGNDNIYIFDGRELTFIGDEIKRDIFGYESQVNSEKLINAQLLYVEEKDQLWLLVPDIDSSYSKKIYIYDIEKETWWYRSYDKEIYSVGVWYKTSTESWDDATGSWAQQAGAWRSPAFKEGFPVTLFGTYHSAGYSIIKQLSTSSVLDEIGYPEAFYETKDISLGQDIRLSRFDLECKGSSTITVYASFTNGTTWIDLGTQNVPSEWGRLSWYCNLTGVRVRLKLVLGNSDIQCANRGFIYTKRIN
jgi:hypothetical protein